MAIVTFSAISSWSTSGSITVGSATSNSTTATINGPGTITANFNSTIPTTPTVIATDTASGKTYSTRLSGNITANQMSNMTLTSYATNTTTHISFTITGETGTSGFCNLTLPKSAIPYGNTPLVIIDNELASNQGYTQDANNYYIWYTIHFSTHEIIIEFTEKTQPPTERTYFIEIAVAIIISAAALAATFLIRLKQKEKGK